MSFGLVVTAITDWHPSDIILNITYLFERQRNKERQTITCTHITLPLLQPQNHIQTAPNHRFTSQKSTSARTGPSWSIEEEPPTRSPRGWQGPNYLSHSYCSLGSTTAGSWRWALNVGTLMWDVAILTARLNKHLFSVDSLQLSGDSESKW